MITFRERHKIATDCANNSTIDADKSLLKKHKSTSSLLIKTLSGVNGNTLAFDLVFELLEFVKETEILSNRKSFSSVNRLKKAREAKKITTVNTKTDVVIKQNQFDEEEAQLEVEQDEIIPKTETQAAPAEEKKSSPSEMNSLV